MSRTPVPTPAQLKLLKLAKTWLDEHEADTVRISDLFHANKMTRMPKFATVAACIEAAWLVRKSNARIASVKSAPLVLTDAGREVAQ